MFYTKYRPLNFSQIVSPNPTADAILNQINSNNVAHAYLLIGPRGTGKTTLARILAKSLNCENPLPTGDACTKCNFCTQIQESSFTDLIEIDAASNRGIDDIRLLREKVKLAPLNGKFKVYIIDEVHMLTNEAFNALLKTLEEPPKNVVFVLCTTEDHKVPETIKSRCQVFKIKRATNSQLLNKLKLIAKNENISIYEKIDDFNKSKDTKKILEADLKKIITNSLGGYRDAETMFEQFIQSGGLYLDDNATSPEEFLYLLLTKSKKEALNSINLVHDSGGDIYSFSSSTINLARNLLLLLNGVNLDDFVQNNPNFEKLTTITNIQDLLILLDLLLEAHTKIKTSVIPQLPLELVVVKFCDGTSSLTLPNAPLNKIPNLTSNTVTPSIPNSNSSSNSDKISKKLETSGETSKVSTNESPEEDNFDLNLNLEIKLIDQDSVSEDISQTQASSLETQTSDASQHTQTPQIQASSITTDIKIVEQKWESIINTASKLNTSVTALLKASRPIKIEEDYLVLEVMYKFHKERLESQKNLQVVNQSIGEHFQEIRSIKCILSETMPKPVNKFESGDLTDMNIGPVVGPNFGADSISKDNATSFFDGGLPIA